MNKLKCSSTARPEGPHGRLARMAATMLSVSLSAWLSACGPGTGGTGSVTSNDAFAQYGAQQDTVCSSSFSDTLSCSMRSGYGPDPDGTGPATFVEHNKVGEVLSLARMDGNHVEWTQRCPSAQFSGDWGRLPDGSTAYVGWFTSLDSPGWQVARMSVDRPEVAEGQPTLITFRVTDPAGVVLAQTVGLVRDDQGVLPPPTCDTGPK